MGYNPTQDDINLLLQKNKTIYTKFEVLNSDMKTIDEIQGVTANGSISIDAEADIRRTYNSTIIVTNKKYIDSETSLFWLDKRVKIYLGLYANKRKEIVWYTLGLFLFNENTFTYDSTTNTLVISCVDLIAGVNGDLGGQLTGLSTQINQGENIQEVLIRTVKNLGHVQKYLIDYYTAKTVPYDMKFGTGVTVYDMVKEIRDLYYSFETFFDQDMFICQQIPMCDTDPVVLDAQLLEQLVISETRSTSLSEVRNCTEVWGRAISAKYYATTCTTTGSNYTFAIDPQSDGDKNDAVFTLVNGQTFGFIADSINGANMTISINSGAAYPIVDENDVALAAGIIRADIQYVVKYKSSKFYYVGQSQIHAMVKLVGHELTPAEKQADMVAENCFNMKYIVLPDSPYTIEKIGPRNSVLSGSDYDLITTDSLAMERAEYENWRTTRLTDTLSLKTIFIPWLDVNQKVSYVPKTAQTNTETQYIIKQINYSIGEGTMDITMCKFYPYYPYIVDTSTPDKTIINI